jgi:hypothetical protein
MYNRAVLSASPAPSVGQKYGCAGQMQRHLEEKPATGFYDSFVLAVDG